MEPDLPDNRFNDGKCDPQGRFWAGTMDAVNWSAPAGNLYRLDPDKTITRMQENVICSNGSGWSPDGRKMYYTESFRYTILVLRFRSRDGRHFEPPAIRHPGQQQRRFSGWHDGGCRRLRVEQRGRPGTNSSIRSRGKLERIVQLPVPRATDCTFGGPDLKTLYVTTARETMTPDQLAAAPLSGSLFAIDCDVRGLPSNSFSG